MVGTGLLARRRGPGRRLRRRAGRRTFLSLARSVGRLVLDRWDHLGGVIRAGRRGVARGRVVEDGQAVVTHSQILNQSWPPFALQSCGSPVKNPPRPAPSARTGGELLMAREPRPP